MDFLRVLIGRTLAVNEGVDEQRALALGLVGSMVATPAVGYAVTIATARQEAPAAPAVDTAPGTVRVPDVKTLPVAEAEKKIKPTGLDLAIVEKKSVVFAPGIVMAEAPEAGTPVSPGSTVLLTVAKG